MMNSSSSKTATRSPRRRVALGGLAGVVALLLGGCGGGSSGDANDSLVVDDDREAPVASSFDPENAYVTAPGVEACSIEDLNAWIDHDMRDYYLYYDQVPTVRLSDYADPDDLIEDLRVAPDRFSSVRDTATQVAQFEEGVLFGYGIWLFYNGAGELRVREIEPFGPMDNAGVERGDILLSINDIPVAALTDQDINDVFGAEEGMPSVFRFVSGDDAPRDLSVAREEFATVTVYDATVRTMRDGSRVGYLGVTSFLDRTAFDVDFHVEWLVENNVDSLILDLRYNGGGRSSQAQRLASQLVGSELDGRLYQQYNFNDKYTADDFVRVFEAPELTLPVSRIVILTTGYTASASEALANGITPYADVTIIGDTTTGKPFASWRVDYCESSANAMRAILNNGNGVSVAGGMQPDCYVEDTWNVPTFSVDDALNRAALEYLATGACATTPLAKTAAGSEFYAEPAMFAVPASEQ